MNCQQKSGVFLNIECQNKQEEKCSVCKKEVCATHCHIWGNTFYCEDCYWEHYLLTTEKSPSSKRIQSNNETRFRPDSSTSHTNSTSSNSTKEPGGFKDGFAGGAFGGAGAAGSWTEGDMQSLNETTDGPLGLLSDSDDTFFYS